MKSKRQRTPIRREDPSGLHRGLPEEGLVDERFRDWCDQGLLGHESLMKAMRVEPYKPGDRGDMLLAVWPSRASEQGPFPHLELQGRTRVSRGKRFLSLRLPWWNGEGKEIPLSESNPLYKRGRFRKGPDIGDRVTCTSDVDLSSKPTLGSSYVLKLEVVC